MTALLVLNWLTREGRLLLIAKIVRTLGYGFLGVILAIYLKFIGFDDFLLGLILTTLLNSAIFTLITSSYADKIGSRKFLLIYAALMSVSGLIFLFQKTIWFCIYWYD